MCRQSLYCYYPYAINNGCCRRFKSDSMLLVEGSEVIVSTTASEGGDGVWSVVIQQLVHGIVDHIHGKPVLVGITLRKLTVRFNNADYLKVSSCLTVKDPMDMGMC